MGALRVETAAGRSYDTPTGALLLRLLGELGEGNQFLVLDRLDAANAEHYMQVYRETDGSFLIPWTVLPAPTLPPHYKTGHWGIAWTGFDVALLVALGATAWAVWLRRQIAIVCALVTGTLLVCDAWFDLMFSWGAPDFWISI